MLQVLDLSGLKPIRELVYDELRGAILSGDLKAGERLVESEVASQMKVSRTPVREALRMLEMEGLIEYVPRKGIFIRGFTREDIVEIYSIRSALESAAVTFSVSNISPEEVSALRDLLLEMQDLTERADVPGLCHATQRLNDILVQSCRMPRLINLISTYQDYLARFRSVTLASGERRFAALRDHEAIVEAVAEKDAEKAQELVKRHLQAALEEYLRVLGGGDRE